MKDAALEREISAFLDAYREAFDRLDGDAVADLYSVPSGIVSGDVYVHWPSREAVAANMRELCSRYRAMGYAGASWDAGEVIALGSQAALANVRWEIRRSESREPLRFRTAYNLLRSGRGWRVLLCTAYEEEPPPPTT